MSQLATGEQAGTFGRRSFGELVSVTRPLAGYNWTARMSAEGVQHSNQSGYSKDCVVCIQPL